MNHAIKSLTTALAVLAGACPLTAQTAPTASDRKQDEILNLSPFTVSSSASRAGRYASLETVSAGRVRVNLMDSSQSVSVITGEMLQDVAGSRIVDTAKYVAGITDATLPTSWEFTNVRGFLAGGRTVDGITYGGYPSGGHQNIDPGIIERIEIVKGPNSILAPRPTSPGGTLNLATKKPQFRNFGLAGVQWGQFDANAGTFDVNRVAHDRLAYRIVGSGRYHDHWWQDAYVRSTSLMPALTYRWSDQTQITLQYTYTDWNAQNYFGLPIDPTSGTMTPGRLLAGVPRDLNLTGDDIRRTTRQHEFKVLVAAGLWRGIQMRLVAAYNTSSHYLSQINTGPGSGSQGGSTDPLTGYWNPGVQYSQTFPYAPSPLTAQPTRIFRRGGVELLSDPRQFNLQNDYACIVERASLKSTTLAGFALAESRNDNSTAYNVSVALPTFDIDHPVPTPWSRGSVNDSGRTRNRFTQFYFSETLSVWQNRLILNAAGSWQDYELRSHSVVTNLSSSSTPHTSLPSYGVVLKPWRDAISLYYAYTEQSSANGTSSTEAVPPLSASRQDEFGARFKVWANKLYLTVSHYAIVQDNFATPNPGNLAIPTPNPLLPSLYSDRTAKGWEYELRANPSKNLSIIGNYTHFKNRDPNNVRFRGVAEKSGAVLASYSFNQENIPALAGVRIAVGVDYMGDRPGDNTPGFAAASTPTNPIPIQPSFYLGSRTLVNLTLTYDSKHRWSAQLNVDNLFDQEYLQSSVTRFVVFPGPPRNFRVSLRRSF